MSKFTRVLSFVLVLAMVFALVACGKSGDETTGGPAGPTNPTGGSNPAGGKIAYTVNVKTNGGMAMENMDIYVYGDAAMTEMKSVGKTDANGQAIFQLAEGQYYAELRNVPKGYDVQDCYPITSVTTDVTLTSSLVNESPEGHIFEVGDVMYDFTFEDNSRIICSCGAINPICDTVISTDEDGNEFANAVSRTNCEECGEALDRQNPQFPSITLSEVLAEKELVVLNFWYTTCSNCVDEFPVLNEAYNTLIDDVAVLGLNSYAPDGVSGVMTFETSFNLPLDFPLGKVSNNFNPGNMIDPITGSGSAGYPTSVFIDRYGVICAIEVGSMTSLTEWVSVMSHFVGDNYQQKLVTYLDELIERIQPTETQPTDEEIKEAIQVGDFTVDYHEEVGDEYSWPFIVTEKDGRTCLKASNQKIYESYAILYAEIELKAGESVGFDYLVSCELNGDALHVIVDQESIYTIAGEGEEWQSAYCWVAPTDGTYSVAFCYLKDSDKDVGEDTVYIDNLRVVTVDEIDTPSYIPSQAALEQPDGSFHYADVVYNEVDGYYHVGTVDGPLLLANLLNESRLLPPQTSLYLAALDGQIVLNGHDYRTDLQPFATVASNSALGGFCTVTYELAEILKVAAQIKGFDGHEDEWLKFCKYYSAYGTDGVQLDDPCAGLSRWSAYVAVEGNGYVNQETGEGQNFFYYDGRPIMPRGYWARFTPRRSGVYQITTSTDYMGGLEAWVFDENGDMILTARPGMFDVTITMNMEAGKDYYIDIALSDIYGIGTVIYNITYMGGTYEEFTECAPGPHTYDLQTGETILPHIDVAINPADGYYHEVLERDANGNPVRFGSIIYAKFQGSTTFFEEAIYSDIINMGGFDFSKTEYDLEILAYLNAYNGDVEATDEYLHSLWGANYAANADLYQIEDVFAGIYHGTGEDLTDEIMSYVDDIIRNSSNPELNGFVAVDENLAELLQLLMEKYYFAGVECAWQGLCCYYKQL